MKKENGYKIALVMLALGVAIGYYLTRIMDRLDCHIICTKRDKDSKSFCCGSDSTGADEDDCCDDTNRPEPYTEPLQEQEGDCC